MKSVRLAGPFFHLLLIAIFLTSCVREEIVPYQDKGQKSKLVIYGFLSPGEQITVFIGKSQPFGRSSYDAADFLEPNATVVITDENGRSLSLSRSTASIYTGPQLDFPIEKGKTYYLKVSAPSLEEITAQTTIPEFAAVWKNTTLSGPEDSYYYPFSGTWDAITNTEPINYGVSIALGNNNISDRSNEGITLLNRTYSVKRDVYLPNANSFKAILLTRDKSFGAFSRKADLNLDLIENLNNAAFTDIISGFKGVIPDAGNINNGIGVFGSYLKDVRTINK